MQGVQRRRQLESDSRPLGSGQGEAKRGSWGACASQPAHSACCLQGAPLKREEERYTWDSGKARSGTGQGRRGRLPKTADRTRKGFEISFGPRNPYSVEKLIPG